MFRAITNKRILSGIIVLFITFGNVVLISSITNGMASEIENHRAVQFIIPRTSGATSFISTWDTTKAGSSASNQVKLPLDSSGTYNFVVKWGDGSSNIITAWNQAETTHTYVVPGVYTINITGTIKDWCFDFSGDCNKILDIKQWGNLQLGNEGRYFYGCTNLNISATDAPDLAGTTDLIWMFNYCANMNSNLSKWDVSHVTNMFGMFHYATSFNQDIRYWDVSRVTNMVDMFGFDTLFNQDISHWNVSSVTDMNGMFYDAASFNQDISHWNVSSVTNMQGMFIYDSSFNQDISRWDVSHVTVMSYMFYDAASFNQDISRWDVSHVTDMSYMFQNDIVFDQNIGKWNISSIMSGTYMQGMFSGAGLSNVNYNKLLVGWARQPLHSNITFDAGNSKYTPNSPASAARAKMVASVGSGGFAWTITDGGILPDTTPPIWNQTPSDQTILVKKPFVYRVNASDSDAYIGQYWINDTTHFHINPLNGNITNATTLGLGTYSLKISVNDSNGNAINANIKVKVIDNIPPTWVQVPQNQQLPVGTRFKYQVNATDNWAIGSYWLNDTTRFHINANNGLITNATIMAPGAYHLGIHVNDTSGNAISTNITVTMIDNTPPTWVQALQNLQIPVGTRFRYKVNATDDWAIGKYWLNDTTHFQINANNGLITNATILAPGAYHLAIHVNDTSGNEISATITISVIKESAPPVEGNPFYSQPWFFAIIGGGIAIAGIVTVSVVKKSRIKTK